MDDRHPWRVRLVAALTLFVVTAAIGAIVTSIPAQAQPYRDGVAMSAPFSVLLCKASNNPAEPAERSFFADMIIHRGTGGVADYLYDQSRGQLDISSYSSIRGWLTTTKSEAEIRNLPHRENKISVCVEAARRAGYTPPRDHQVVTIYNFEVGDVGTHNGVLMDTTSYNSSFAAHEMLHTMHLGHSWSTDQTYLNGKPNANPGEYDDPWDEMSAMNTFSNVSGRFAPAPVGLNAFNLDTLGWLPRNRIGVVASPLLMTTRVRIASLDVEGMSTLPLLVRVPISNNDPTHYYTLEYRKKLGWDDAIPHDTVLIHEIKANTSYLLRDSDLPGRPPVQHLATASVEIDVEDLSDTTATISVTVKSGALEPHSPNTCKEGFVWRQADAYDYVCVTPETYLKVQHDNANIDHRFLLGEIGCHTGLTPRLAFINDHVCVMKSIRDQMWKDNTLRWERLSRR
ncbi:MAG: hypothetical protein H0T78_02815 [Longispora sp.]|nr:hypothetical protein [Longispora sp. (in: high G+C Gram-positive bacteria)]